MTETASSKTNVEVIDRKSGKRFIEKIYGEAGMKLCYGSNFSSNMTSFLLANHLVSKIFGWYQDSGLSRKSIKGFVEKYDINTSEPLKQLTEFNSFNDFFARKLKNGSRPIDDNPRNVIAPGDGRLLVFPELAAETFGQVKWAPIRLQDLFAGDEDLIRTFSGGSCAILRLCPVDYHRFHFPVGGAPRAARRIQGKLHSVHRYALEQKIPVFCLNERMLTEVVSETYGRVLFMEVGAMMVGSIVQQFTPGRQVERGQEKGYFKFGGSTIILFFERGRLLFDQDLISNSSAGLETYVRMGEHIATVS